jgi:hypothetical protein
MPPLAILYQVEKNNEMLLKKKLDEKRREK